MISLPENKRKQCFLLVASGVFLSTLDSSMINVALPAVARDFHAGIATVDLVVLAYLMVISVSLVLWGRIADSFGKGRVYLVGMALFGIAAVGCGLASNFSLLVILRSIQACGAAMMMAVGPALIKSTTPPGQLGRYLGLIGVATSCGLMSGPAVSGFLLSHFSWRAVFFIPLPVCLLVSLLAFHFLLPALDQEEHIPFTFDWRGGTVWVLLVSAYVLFIKMLPVALEVSLLMIPVTIVLVFLLFYIEKKVEQPILPLSLIREQYFWTAAITSTLSFCGLFIVIILLPFYLDTVQKYDSGKIGLVMMALPVSLVFFSPFSGRMYDRLGSARLISSAGLFVSAIAVILLLQLTPESSLAYISLCLAMMGAGQSIFLSPNSASVLNRVDERYAGVSAGILATSRNFGMMSGAGIAGAGFSIFSGFFIERTSKGDDLAFNAPYMLAQNGVFVIALALLMSGMFISLIRK